MEGSRGPRTALWLSLSWKPEAGRRRKAMASSRVTSSSAVSVWYSTQDGSANAIADYWPSYELLLFPPGTTTRRAWIWVRGDVVPETPEYFFITLAAPWGLAVGDKYGIGVIVDDD